MSSRMKLLMGAIELENAVLMVYSQIQRGPIKRTLVAPWMLCF